MKKQFLLGLMAMLLPLATWADNELTVKVNDKEEGAVFEYNGTQTLANLSVKVYLDDTKLSDSPSVQYYYQITDNEGKPVNANGKVGVGTYTITAIGQTQAYTGMTGTATFSVEAKKVTSLTLANVTKEYGTSDEDIDLLDFVTVPNGLASGDVDEELADFVGGLKLQRKEGQDLETVGSRILVGVTADEDAESNYKYDPVNGDTNVPLTITAKELTVTQVNTREYYKGKKFDVTNANAKTFFKLDGILEADKDAVAIETLIGEDPIEDAGEYPLTVTLAGDKAGNYTVKTLEDNEHAHVNLTIDKATLTMTPAEDQDLSKTYGEDDPESLYNQFTFTPSHGTYAAYTLTEEELKAIVSIERATGEDVKYSTEEGEETKVVGYDITIALTETGKKNFTLEGYDEEEKPQFKINPKEIGDGNGNAFDGYALEVIEDSIVYRAAPYEGYHKTEGDPIKDFVTVTYTKDEETEGESLTEGEDYYIYISATLEGQSTDAGSALTLGVFGRGNYTGSIFKQNLTIKKAKLEITPKSTAVLSKVDDGGNSGNLNAQFDFNGLKEVDEDGNPNPDAVLVMMAKSKNVGSNNVDIYKYDNLTTNVSQSEYKSTDPEKGLKNYIVDYTKVKYEILAKEFVLTGGEYTTAEDGEAEDPIVTNTEKIGKYAGLEVDKVTVKTLTSLSNAGYRADRWYTLVLPFDVTVREISSQLGYAIVNVPQEANNNAEDMVYGLTMGTIPAHTVMAFKVDATNADDEEEVANRQNPTLTFKNKKIVAIPEADDWFTDAQGNQAIGTYEPLTDITGENQFWLIPGGAGSGSFQRASVQSYTIQPFNGYFQFASTPANARIILEEADGTTTAINAITGEVVSNNAEGWYSIDGMKLNAQPTQKGVYINNGKKVVIK